MFNIGDFLRRFSTLTPPDEFVRKQVLQSIQNILHYEVLMKDVSVRNGVVYIKTNSLVKNKVFMKKELLLKDLQKTLGDKAPNDIR